MAETKTITEYKNGTEITYYTGTLSCGCKYKVEADGADDWAVVKAIGRAQNSNLDTTVRLEAYETIADKLLGEGGFEAIAVSCTTPTGRLPIGKVAKAINELLEAARKN